MPTLAQMFDLARKKSYFSRPDDEVWAALNYGAWRVYSYVLKEFRGFFIKWDETSLTLTPNVDEYTLPADLAQIVRLSERLSVNSPWLPMVPADLNSQLFIQQQFQDTITLSSGLVVTSDFTYYGPYLDSASTTSPTGVYKIRVAPKPTDTRACQLVYSAKFVPIINAGSQLMIPPEGSEAMLAWAVAELLRANSDQLAAEYEAKGQRDITEFLTFVRERQIQQRPTVEPYVADLD